MSLIQAKELKTLIETADRPCISIYLPTTEPGQDAHQNLIRFKNSLNQIEAQLYDRGWNEEQVAELLQPLHLSIPHDNTDFWKQQQGGMAIFLAPGAYYCYTLPLEFDDLALVADRFYLKPLLPIFIDSAPFYVLAIAKNSLRLFWCVQRQITPVELPQVPQSLEAALQYDDPEQQLQLHSTQAGGSAPAYHGQGGGSDEKTDLRRWFQQVDAALCTRLQSAPGPLVLAGVEYLTAIYREVSDYNDILSETIAGNPETLTETELGDRAWELLQPRFSQRYETMVDRYRELLGTGQASADVATVVAAADRGQVDALFVPRGRRFWGRFNRETGKVDIGIAAASHREDLANLAAVRTFVQGGTVYAVDPEAMPSETELAAILRYPVPAS